MLPYRESYIPLRVSKLGPDPLQFSRGRFRRSDQGPRRCSHSPRPLHKTYFARPVFPLTGVNQLTPFLISKEKSMPLINVKLIDGVFSQSQRKQIAIKLTERRVTDVGRAGS